MLGIIFTIGIIVGSISSSIICFIFLRPTIGQIFIDTTGERDYYRFVFNEDPEFIKKKKNISFTVKNNVIIDDLHNA